MQWKLLSIACVTYFGITLDQSLSSDLTATKISQKMSVNLSCCIAEQGSLTPHVSGAAQPQFTFLYTRTALWNSLSFTSSYQNPEGFLEVMFQLIFGEGGLTRY